MIKCKLKPTLRINGWCYVEVCTIVLCKIWAYHQYGVHKMDIHDSKMKINQL